ncbi:MAG: folylpolyglutamate synthase/dihydrofolate synthase family protein [Coriobacteriia bacterium]|nr:folylpolyglutamate synthase/dihydrofolate synthase family protein [Coriobacteriia bacterium]
MFDPVAYINTPRWQYLSLGLERITLLLDKLGNPQDKLKFVHVAGTNGKGSVCAYLAQVLQASGYKTGLFTSPYIESFEERIRVDGHNIAPAALREATLAVKEHANAVEAETGEHPTEFELMTAVAFLHFARVGCQVVVAEVGLGGRLDSTNVIAAPEVSVISRLGLDHTGVLGNTLEEIAAEKAGIIKRSCPVVCAPQQPAALEVVQRVAAQQESPCVVVDASQLEVGPVALEGTVRPVGPTQLERTTLQNAALSRRFSYRGTSYTTRLAAAYQPENAAVALETLEVLRSRGWNIPAAAEAAGIAATTWPGRFELLPTTPLALVDGGHNPQGARALARSLGEVRPLLLGNGCSGPLVLLVGVLADKDYPAMLDAVLPLANAVVCTQPENPRALPAAKLARAVQARTYAPVVVRESAAQAVDAACRLTFDDGLVVAFGSLYQVGAVKQAFRMRA